MVRYVNVEIPLGGVDQYSDSPYVLKGGKLATVENFRMREPPKLTARPAFIAYGTTALDSSTIGNCYQVIGKGKETLIANANTLYAFDTVSEKWANKGYLSECHVSRFPVHAEVSLTGACPQDASCAYNQGITVVAWSGSDDAINAVVVDAVSETVLATYAQSGGGGGDRLLRPRVIAVGNYIYILSQPAAGTGLNYTRIDVTSGNYSFAALAGLTLTGTAQTTVAADACSWSSTQFLVTYWDSGANRVYVDRIETTGHTVDATRNNTKTSCTALGICKASSTLGFVCFCGTGGTSAGLEVVSFDATLATVGGPTSVDATTTIRGAAVVATAATRGVVVWEEPSAGGVRSYAQWRDFASNTALGTARSWGDVVPVTKPFTYSAKTYCLFVNNSDATRTTSNANTESTYYLGQIATDTATVAGRLMGYACRGLAMPTIYQGYLSDWAVNSTQHETALGLLTKFKFVKDDDSDKLLARNGLTRIRFDFDPKYLHSSAEWAHGLFIAGACPRWYDGENVYEHGFPWGPEWATSAVAATAGGVLTAGTYLVASTYEHQDAGNFIARSKPSLTYTVTLTGAPNLAMQATLDHECDLSAKPTTTSGTSGIRVRHWKTLADATEPFYNAATGSPEEDTGFIITFGTVCALDMTNANAPQSEVLYTTGDILDNGPTPPCKVAVRHGDRIFLAGLEDPELVAFSQPFVYGEQPRFNEALTLRFPEAVTALASMDASLVVFTKNSTFVVSGDGPPATGGLELGFGITTISRSIGCPHPRSPLVTPKGCMFASTQGFYLLDRGMGLSWVGAAVKDHTDTYTVISGAAVDPNHPEAVWWAHDNGTDGVRIIYNFELDQWMTDTFAGTVRPFAGAVVWRNSLNKYTLAEADSDATIRYDWQQHGAELSDYIDTQIITGDIALKELQGWQFIRRMFLLLEYTNSVITAGVSLTVQVAYDIDGPYEETHTWSGTTLAALGRPARGTINCVSGAELVDGETFTISDGTTSVVFEFNSTGGVGGGNVAVAFTSADSVSTVRDAMVTAINAHAFNVTAQAYLNHRILLRNDSNGPTGNAACSETVTDPDFTITTMGGGYHVDQIEVPLGRLQCKTVRFRIRVTGTADDAGGINVRGMLLDAGFTKLPTQLSQGAIA